MNTQYNTQRERRLRQERTFSLPEQIMFFDQGQIDELEQLSERDLERILRAEARDWRG